MKSYRVLVHIYFSDGSGACSYFDYYTDAADWIVEESGGDKPLVSVTMMTIEK